MTPEFHVGDRVYISKNSEYYKNNSISNPRDTIGTIVFFGSPQFSHWIKVKWDNSNINNYRPSDLMKMAKYIEED